jgi:phosphate transport system substrate-binding protein
VRALIAAGVGFLLVACGSSSSSPADVGSGTIVGAGSTFVAPFYNRAFYQYHQMHNAVAVNYQPVGSSTGIQAISKNTVDFGATDVPMSASELQAAGGADTLVQVPTTLGVISIAYNLPGIGNLRLDGPAIAGVFLGHIKKWNDPALQAINQARLPNLDITVVHRSDGSGSTYALTDYLSKQSPEWKKAVSVGKAVNWPVGEGGSGNQGVAKAVQQTEGAIGYVELAYVIQTKMQQAYVKNRAGKYLQASLEGATQAALNNSSVSPTNFSITDEPGAGTYPLATFSWVVLRQDQRDAGKGKALVYLLQWLVTDGQQYSKDLEYAPLPKQAADYANTGLRHVTTNGAPILRSS